MSMVIMASCRKYWGHFGIQCEAHISVHCDPSIKILRGRVPKAPYSAPSNIVILHFSNQYNARSKKPDINRV